MTTIDSNSLTRAQKCTLYSLMEKVMDADNKQLPEELAMLEELKIKFQLSQEDILFTKTLSIDDCRNNLLKFEDSERAIVKSLLENMAWADGIYVDAEKELITSLELSLSHYELQLKAEWRDKGNTIVACYTKEKDGTYWLKDIRSLGFSPLKYKNEDEISIPINPIDSMEEDTYYEFTWKLQIDSNEPRGHRIIPADNNFKKVEAHELVDRLFKTWENSAADVVDQMTRVQEMVNTQLTASSDGTFIYELLQNANDYPVEVDDKVQLVDVEFHLTDNYLIYRHTGRNFSPRNIAAISKISAGEKTTKKNTIGYKGIGFKTVFSENKYVFLESGEYTLRFDQGITEVSSKFPWQIMPIWTPKNQTSLEIQQALSDVGNFRVQMAILPKDKSKLREDEKSFEFIFNDIFKDEKDILFIPNLKSVKVFYDGKEQIYRIKDQEKWAMTKEPLVYTFSPEEIKTNNDEVEADKHIPKKYKDFADTRVSFACRKEDRKLMPVDNARVYCYLPTQVSFGLPILMNTDMIPNGARDDIVSAIKFNHRLAKIAGRKLAEWICSLLKSGEYDLSSVFDIIPSFTLTPNYKDFVKEIKEGFDEEIQKLQFIPTEVGEYTTLEKIIVDDTGITAADIFNDVDILTLTELNGELPAKELRSNQKFIKFVKQYNDDSRVLKKKNIIAFVEKDICAQRLANQNINNKFLKYILEKNWLNDFKDKKIFLAEQNNTLCVANDIYYDVEKYKFDITAFLHHISFLSLATREYFKNDKEQLAEIEGVLQKFAPKSFVDDVLLSAQNIEQTKERLHSKWTSLHFYKFLSENVDFSPNFKQLPFFNSENKVVDGFTANFIFADNELGKKQVSAKWLEGVSFTFVSAEYGEDVLNYFKKVNKVVGSDIVTPTFGVLDYDQSVLINKVILGEKYSTLVNTNQQKDDETHKSFVSFCYANSDSFTEGSLKSYALKVNERNQDGTSRYELTEANVFFKSSAYDNALVHPWMSKDWMFSLDENLLLSIPTEIDKLKKFYKDKFGIKELTAEIFYGKIVSKNIENIFKAASKPSFENAEGTPLSVEQSKAIETAKLCNFDFVSYLDTNTAIVFNDNDFTKFNNLPLIDSNDEFISNTAVIFFYDKELEGYMSKAWLPKGIVNMCSNKYAKSPVLGMMQVNRAVRIKKYDFNSLYLSVIVPNITEINTTLEDKSVNIDFHNTIIKHLGSILEDDRKKMFGAKVFVQGTDQPIASAVHKLVSKTVEELINLSLVNYNDLNLLAPEYHANENTKYWKDALGNETYTVKSFLKWLPANKNSVITKLQNKDTNIKFWRWAKANVKEDISSLSGLPILLKDNDVPVVLSGETYFSDAYLETAIESLVTTVASNAQILSPNYISSGEGKTEWVTFWACLGVKQNEVEVLENVIRHRLSTTEVASLPELIWKNRSLLEAKFNNNLIAYLSTIQLRCADCQYRSAKECVYVSCYDAEPFEYITLPNRVSYALSGVNNFIGEIIQTHNKLHYITDLTKWRQEKIESYLTLQLENKQTTVHMPLIKDLAALINANKDNLSPLPKIGDIQLLARDNTYKIAKSLTEGSKYEPFFDFEECSLALDYVSDAYLSCGVPVVKLFNYMKVHHNLEERDLPLLNNYKTACYFWKSYLGASEINIRDKNIKHALSFITSTKNPFKNLVCVPTADYKVVSAESLYSLHIKDKVALLENFEILLPLDIVADGVLVEENSTSKEGVYFMDKLQFKSMLGVQHCFDALCNIPSDMQTSKEKELRKELVKWIVAQKGYIAASLGAYRADDNSLWVNGVSEKVQIATLYALNPNDNLEQYFGNNAKVIDPSYVAVKDKQLEAFSLLGIKVIYKSDIDTVPADKRPANNSEGIKKKLKFFTLILSGIESSESWKSLYEGYCTKVDDMSFWTCSAIEKKYKQDNSVVKRLSGFYHENGKNEFYYKGDLESKLVFLDYVNAVKKHLDIQADIEIVKRVMDSIDSACDLVVDEYSRLLLDEGFVKEVRKTRPNFNKPIEVSNPEPAPLPNPNPQPIPRPIPQPESQPEPQPEPHPEPQPEPKKGKAWEEMTPQEVEILKKLLNGPLSIEDRKVQNCLVKLRLYSYLISHGATLELSEDELREKLSPECKTPNFELSDGRYAYACSAMSGIMYVSPPIWDKLNNAQYVLFAYTGDDEHPFRQVESINDLKELIQDDAILVKLGGRDKLQKMETLYTSVLDGMQDGGYSFDTYTLIRLGNAGKKYEWLFKVQSKGDYTPDDF